MKLEDIQAIADQVYADAQTVSRLLERVLQDFGPDAEISIEELGDEAQAILDRVKKG